jgi:hypothetical protein
LDDFKKIKVGYIKLNFMIRIGSQTMCQLDEAIHVAATDEEYKKYAGIYNNEKLIERLAELKLSNSKIFINSFSNPRALVLGSIEDIAYSKTKKLELELRGSSRTMEYKGVCARNKADRVLKNQSLDACFSISLEMNSVGSWRLNSVCMDTEHRIISDNT